MCIIDTPYDMSKLNGRIVEKYGNQSNFADALKISKQTMSLKMNCKVNMTREEILRWSELLDIGLEDIGVYFFTLKV